MPDHERTPLLPTASSSSHDSASSSSSGSLAPASSSSSTQRAARPQLRAPINSSADLILTEDDIAIQGMVLALLADLSDRGYVLPPGLPVLPPDMPQDEADAEIAFLRTVFTVPRHRTALDRHLPDLTRAAAAVAVSAAGGGANGSASGTETPPVGAGSILSTNRPAATNGRKGAGAGYGSNMPARPSPLSSQTIDTTVLTSPSALFLASLLSLLVSLQREYHGSVEETDPGVDGELRMFKARRELGERLYAVVAALLDSYLLTGDARTNAPGTYDEEDDEGDDALVSLLFHDFPLNYDSMDRGTSCESTLTRGRYLRRAILTLLPPNSSRFAPHPFICPAGRSGRPHFASGRPREHGIRLAKRPVAATESRNPRSHVEGGRRTTRSILYTSVRFCSAWLIRSSATDTLSPRSILQSQTYILSTLHAAITVYILMFSAYSHFDAFNPLAPDLVTIPERSGSRPVKTWSLLTEVVWWLWIAGSFGWAGEVGRIWVGFLG